MWCESVRHVVLSYVSTPSREHMLHKWVAIAVTHALASYAPDLPERPDRTPSSWPYRTRRGDVASGSAGAPRVRGGHGSASQMIRLVSRLPATKQTCRVPMFPADTALVSPQREPLNL